MTFRPFLARRGTKNPPFAILLAILLVWAAAVVGFRVSLAHAQQFPKPVGFVNDFANVIDPVWEGRIEALCREIERKTGAEVAVATMPTIGDEDYRDYANRLFEAWKIGKKGKDNGVLIFNAVKERKVWIEIGYGLEPIINDAKAGDIYRHFMRPLLRQGRYGEAFYVGVLKIGQIIAKDAGVTLEPPTSEAPVSTVARRPAQSPVKKLVGFLFTLFFLMLLFRTGLWPLIFLGGGGRGGWGGGGFGGGFGGGGFGGGFGGFGGGASGGGGAGGGY